jgi:hypothetical protein
MLQAERGSGQSQPVKSVSKDVVGESVRGLLLFSRCEVLLWEAGSWGGGQFRNLETAERLQLEAATKQRQ